MGYPKGKARNPGITQDENAAIKALVGKPLALESEADKNAAARMAVLLKHIQEKSKPLPPNPYQNDFWLFMRDLVYTKDEAAGGRVAKFPDWDYFPECCDALITCSPLLIDKARRVLISWLVCGFDLWLVAGGQDPRWVNEQGVPILMQSTENRKVVVASQKLEGPAGSAWFIEERIRFIYEQFVERGFREQFWPDFPEIQFKFGKALASNGGQIEAIAQGAHQARGLGATFVHWEELSACSEAKQSLGALLPTLTGGGKICCIATAQSGTFAARIVLEQLGAGRLSR